MFARIEKERALATDSDYILHADRPKDLSWQDKPVDVSIEECAQEGVEFYYKVSFYELNRDTGVFDSTQHFEIDEPSELPDTAENVLLAGL